ncbi:hypothetical protein V8F33_004939 [Rhypophila sp. PSN 637]
MVMKRCKIEGPVYSLMRPTVISSRMSNSRILEHGFTPINVPTPICNRQGWRFYEQFDRPPASNRLQHGRLQLWAIGNLKIPYYEHVYHTGPTLTSILPCLLDADFITYWRLNPNPIPSSRPSRYLMLSAMVACGMWLIWGLLPSGWPRVQVHSPYPRIWRLYLHGPRSTLDIVCYS